MALKTEISCPWLFYTGGYITQIEKDLTSHYKDPQESPQYSNGMYVTRVLSAHKDLGDRRDCLGQAMSKDSAGAEALQERVQLQAQLLQWMAVVIGQNLANQVILLHRCVHACIPAYLHTYLHRYIEIYNLNVFQSSQAAGFAD